MLTEAIMTLWKKAPHSQPNRQTCHSHACYFNSKLTPFYNHNCYVRSPHLHPLLPSSGNMVFQRWLLKPVVMFSIDKQATSAAPSLLPPTFIISLHVYLTLPLKPHFCVHLSILFFVVKPTLFMISFWSSYWSASSSTSICYLTSCPTAAPPFLLILLVTMALFFLLLSLPKFKAACLGNVRTCILLLFLVLFYNLTPGNHCCQSVAVWYGRQKHHWWQQERHHQNCSSWCPIWSQHFYF